VLFHCASLHISAQLVDRTQCIAGAEAPAMGAHRRYREHKFAFSRHILALRTRAALTQSALAEHIGVHLRSVQNWETGASYPKAETLQRLIAVFLSCQVFTSGSEHAEAQALWSIAAEDGPHALAAFDKVWFARALALHTTTPIQADHELAPSFGATPAPKALPVMPRALIDWGEAIAVPALYGRDTELATLHQWIVEDRCRVVTLVGIGGMGKSSLAIVLARSLVAQFEVVLFRSLQNGPPLAEVLDQTIRAVSDQRATPPDRVPDKIALLVELFRTRRCLLIFDNFEAIMQPHSLTGVYRTGYAEYGTLLERLSEREHQSCLILTSREKPVELGWLEGRNAPVRAFPLTGLDDRACEIILEQRDIVGTADDIRAQMRLYGGNPLALHLVTEPIRELFGGNVGAFLAAGDAFFNGVGKLMEQQCARTSPLEQAILGWLVIERELVPVSVLLDKLGATAPKRDVLAALESLHRRVQIERGADQPAFTLQPAILEFVTDQLLGNVCQEIMTGQPFFLHSHALIQATAKNYVRLNQERLIATPLLERLVSLGGGMNAAEQQLLSLLDLWRDQSPAEQGYGPGNVINLLRLLRGHLCGLDFGHLAIKQVYLQGVDMQDASLAGAIIQDCLFTETFGVISAVAISSNGIYWAACSRSGEVRVWVAGGKTLHRMWQAHTANTWALAFSPDGHTLVSGSWDGTVKLWDIDNGTLLWSGQHTSHIQRASFSPNGHMIASSGGSATVWIWNVHSGTQLQTLTHPQIVTSMAWSPDGHLLATGDRAGIVRIWVMDDTRLITCMHTLTSHKNTVSSLVFSPDSHALASASWDGTVKLWQMADARLQQTFVGHMDRVVRVVWSPDGRILATGGSDRTIWLWDVERNSHRGTLSGHAAGVWSIAFTPDSRSLLSGSEDGTLRVWDIATEQCIRVIEGHTVSLYDVDWSPDGTRLVSGGADALVTIWDVAGATPPRVLREHSGSVFGVRWSPDGRWVASSEWDNAIRLWNMTSSEKPQILRHPDQTSNILYGLAWSPDGQQLASGTYRRGVHMFDMAAQRQRWPERVFPTWIGHVAWHPDGTQVAGGGDDGAVYVWDAADGTLLQSLLGHPTMITSLAWSPDSRLLASGNSGIGNEGGQLFMWDTTHWEHLPTLTVHGGSVSAIAWLPGGAQLVSGGSDGKLRWWDVANEMCVQVRDAHQGTVHALRINSGGTTLASCGDDGAIMLWELQRGAHLQTLRRDRPYERLDIADIKGLTVSQRATLHDLGALDGLGDQQAVLGDSAQVHLAVADPVDAAPRARGTRRVTPDLPFQPAPFIGRDTELAEIAQLLANPGCRLLTLLGSGGIGKTRLALAVAARQTAAFADGVAFVGLAAIGTPDQIVSAIGESLGLSFAGQPDPTRHVLGYLHDRQLLLLLDNAEHLLAGADLVTDILAHAPQITILVTSHERLNLQAEWLFQVDGLGYPLDELDGSTEIRRLTDLTDYSAVQLFVQRARQIQPDILLNEVALATIVRICQHVAGIPLAIELAAAGVRNTPLATMERQIRANLDVLATTLRDVPARHRSMRAVFDHSWNLLSVSEQALFSRLAVFRGGWTMDAAVQVAGATLPTLAALIDKSLVRQADSAPQLSIALRTVPREPRYTMLDLLREYALEQLAVRGEVKLLQRVHASYYLALADAVAAHWDTPAAEQGIAQLDHEHENMRAALRRARDGGERTLGLLLAGALRKFWRRRGAISEGRGWLEDLLARDDSATIAADPAAQMARLRALEGAAWLAADQHEYAHARQLFEQGSVLRRALGEPEDATNLLHNTALEARAAGQYQRATAQLEDAVAQHRAIGDRRSLSSAGHGLSLFLLGLVRREQGDFARATALFEACVELHRAIGDNEGLAVGLLGLSDVARDQGDTAGVRAYGEASLTILRQLGVQWAIGFALNNLALAAAMERDLPSAFVLANESVALFRTQSADASLAEVLITLGRITQAQGDAAAAYAALAEALQLVSAVGPRVLMPAGLEGLASLLEAQKDVDLATRLSAAATALRIQMGTPAPPNAQFALEQVRAACRSALGDDAFTAVWAEAQKQPLEQILRRILDAAVFDSNVIEKAR
jgi:WD40 repeat protein/predicted ATPase/DNA-binding XRE family transcriptional regulator